MKDFTTFYAYSFLVGLLMALVVMVAVVAIVNDWSDRRPVYVDTRLSECVEAGGEYRIRQDFRGVYTETCEVPEKELWNKTIKP